MEIEGKKAIVVGGASGFGRATAESLAKRGASVAVLDRPQSKGAEVADAIGGTFHEVDGTSRAPRRPCRRPSTPSAACTSR
jgi:NAD(P)-dependent dehydrogenase (short-subunit alcohol dehydrogenase family)